MPMEPISGSIAMSVLAISPVSQAPLQFARVDRSDDLSSSTDQANPSKVKFSVFFNHSVLDVDFVTC